jgi:3',5'-cyclic AMP phosphodiesterase CpdA
MQPILTFVQISDSHLGPAYDYESHGARPFGWLERVVETINNFPQPPDFVIHSGDLINDQGEPSMIIAAEALNRLHVPLYVVNGNHDNAGLLRKYFGGPLNLGGDPDAPLDYTFELKGERFMVLDSFDLDVRQPSGQISERQLDQLRAEAAHDGPPLTIFLHHVPFEMGSPWLDERMLLVNGEALHAALLPLRDRLRGVFFGHLHRSCHIVRDGITYTCAPSSSWQYGWRAWDPEPIVDSAYPPSYQLVDYFTDQVVVIQHAIPHVAV